MNRSSHLSHRRLLGLAVVVTAGLLVAGCGASTGADRAATGSSATSSTSTSTPATASSSSSISSSTTKAATCAHPGLPTTVAYRTIPGVPADAVSLDVYAPPHACGAPVVMWVHGGGYHIGDKAGRNTVAKAHLFNSKGWVLVSVNYRLTKRGDPASARYPDHYEDVASAIRWVHDSIGGYGGDPSRIALLGHSAGADIVSNVADNPKYLADHGLSPSALVCAGPLDTAGFDKVAATKNDESAQWKTALGNDPHYLTDTSATRLITHSSELPDTIGVYRGTASRQAIEKAYLAKVASTGAKAVAIDARSLSHNEVSNQIGAPGDTVMTAPIVSFLSGCFR